LFYVRTVVSISGSKGYDPQIRAVNLDRGTAVRAEKKAELWPQSKPTNRDRNMTEIRTAEYIPQSSATGEPGKVRLKGKMGPMALMLTVLAFSAPMAVVEGFIPYAIYFGGPGATFAFVLTGIMLILFAVGYVTMAKHVPRPGDFYAFVTAGLGKIVGLGAAFLATFGYLCVLGGNYVFFGVSTSSLITTFGGPETFWLQWAIVGWAIVTILGHFHIELSAKILSVSMLIEVLIVMIFNVFVLAKGGAEGLSVEPFTFTAFTQGDVAVTMLFTILVFLGFEATALFRDEVRDPNHTIPRATYGAVILIGILYVLACYALVSAFGSKAWDMSKTDPTGMFPEAIGLFVAPAFKQIAYCSVLLSIFAANVAIHNVCSRYLHNLAADRTLPFFLSFVHPRHFSPYVASAAVGLLAGTITMASYYSGMDGNLVYAVVIGIGALAVIFLMGLVCIAIIGWFVRTGIPKSENAFKVYIAPAIAGAVMLATTIYAGIHIELLVGGNPGENYWIVWLLIAVFVFGMALSMFFRSHRPDIYALVGRTEQTAGDLPHL
jgi:amino acid transporter